MRSSVITAKPNDYVQAARALGASPTPDHLRHILPNSIAPMIVVATIASAPSSPPRRPCPSSASACKPPAISWGIEISAALRRSRTTPHMLLFPGVFLALTVLAFIMLGDAVRDALDPKNR